MKRKATVLLTVCMTLAALLLAEVPATAAGPAGWTKIADRGIGDPRIILWLPYKEFGGKLYGFVPFMGGPGPAVPIWTYDGNTFSRAAADGLGDPGNVGFTPGGVFQGYFYCGTANANGGQLWRTSDGATWERVGQTVFTDPNDNNCSPLGEQGGKLLVGFDNYAGGVKVWSYDGNTWARANEDGFGPANLVRSISLPATLGGRIHVVGQRDPGVGGSVIPLAYSGGTTWEATGQPGFGDLANEGVHVLAADDLNVYAGTDNASGGQVWRYGGASWTRMDAGIAGVPENTMLIPTFVNGKLYLTSAEINTMGPPQGIGKLYRQKADGSFELISNDGFGDGGNVMLIVGAAFSGRLFMGTFNMNGFQVWTYPISPLVESMSPGEGPYGTLVTIKGMSFGPGDPATSYVSFAGARVYAGDVLSWSDTEIKVRVPDSALPGLVTVVTSMGGSNGMPFELTLSKEYYFAEGSTREGGADGRYEEWLTVMNPSDEATGVHVTYYTGAGLASAGRGVAAEKDYAIGPSSRLTINVNQDVGPGLDVSARLVADSPVVAERSIYFDYQDSVTGGHTVLGAPEPGERWYFAEGSTRDNLTDGWFDEWLCLLNPGKLDANVKVTYMLSDGSNLDAYINVPAMSRVTRNVSVDIGVQADASIRVVSDYPVVAERPTYFDYHWKWAGGDCVLGARSPATSAYFAEGCTYDWADEWLCVQNPNDQAATVTLTYQVSGGIEAVQNAVVPPSSRATVDVRAAAGEGKDVSVALESSLPVIAERAMYFDCQDKYPGGHVCMGSQGPRKEIYFAEGTTRQNEGDGYFEEWLSIQNLNDELVPATITFLKPNGVRATLKVNLGAKSRNTIPVNTTLGPDTDAGIIVESESPLVVERVMYFDYHGFAVGGSDSRGYGL